VAAIAATVLAVRSAAEGPAPASGQLAVVSWARGETLYVLDGGAVRGGPVPKSLPARVDIDSLAPLPLPTAMRPVALATWLDRLVVADAGSQSIRALNPETGELTTLFAGVPIDGPPAMAVSPEGDVVLLDRRARATVWYSTAQIGGRARGAVVPWIDVGEPLWIAFNRRDLVTYDLVKQRFAILPRPAEQAPGAQGPVAARVVSFGFVRGVLYLADGERVLVKPVNDPPLPLVCPACPPRIGGVYATPRQLFVQSASDRSVTVVSRPVPVAVRLDSAADDPDTRRADAGRALGALYEYLSHAGVMPVRPYVASADDRRFGDAVQHSRSVVPGSLPEPRSALDRLLCSINGGLCAGGAFPWDRPIAAGQPVYVPDFRVASDSQLKAIADLNGTSAVERLRSDDLFDRQSDADWRTYIQRLNQRTFEDQLAELGLVVATPARNDLEPGTLLTVARGIESVVGTTASLCKVPVPVFGAPVPPGIPDRIPVATIKDYIPLSRAKDGTSLRDQLREGDPYQATFGQVELVRLSPDAVLSARETLGACAASVAKGGERVLLVTEALAVDGGLYDLRAAGQLRITGRFYIAYRAVPFDRSILLASAATLAGGVPPADLKPGGPQDVLRRRTGPMNLPVVTWSVDMLVPGADLDDPASPLRAIERSGDNRILLLRKEVLPVKARSIPSSGRQVDPRTREEILKARQALLEAINYRDVEAESSVGVAVGIGENKIDLEHPGLVNQKSSGPESAVFVLSGDGFDRYPIPGSYTPLSESTRPFSLPDDHGVHVAGMLAARPTALLPGLLPRADLYLIDTSDLTGASLHDGIEKARLSGVSVFNFSFTLDRLPEEDFNAVRLYLMRDFQSLLFVVAAGDEGVDLASVERKAPITWMRDAEMRSHMIGVGATTPDGGHYLSQYEDEQHRSINVSNFGSEYVQIAAPGRDVFSLASRNGYAVASGSSQAVPQVTAAAAMLFAHNRFYPPSSIKARLIYTADPLEDSHQVWGGRLNVRRAVWEADHNVYLRKSDSTGPYRRADFRDVNLSVQGKILEPDGQELDAPPYIPLRDVLRMRWGEGGYRMHFYDETLGCRLRLVTNAEVHGQLKIRVGPQVYDEATRRFGDTPDKAEDGADVSDVIWDYVARTPLPQVDGNRSCREIRY